jgi:hypothetical protein
MKNLNVISLVFLLLGTFPAVSHAAGDLHANAVYANSLMVYAPQNAVGAPDGAYADFQDELQYITLDMGEDEEGTGDLTLTFYLFDFNAQWQVDFLDADMNVLQSDRDGFALYSTSMTVAYTQSEPYRYVKVYCPEDELWRLDALEAASIVATEEPSDEVMEEPQTEEPAPTEDETGPPQGLLVKLVDDGDPSTTVDEAVYAIGADGKRHAFPSETVYKTWWQDFDDVAFIDPENLASYELGENVTVRPGTWLVKITTDPKVYAVEPDGVLRWITTEALAKSLYGKDWAARVIDVPDVFWGNYTVGDPITVEKHPAGSVGVTSTGAVIYLDENEYFTLPGSVREYMRFVSDFQVTVSDEKLEQFNAAGDLAEDPDIAFPF